MDDERWRQVDELLQAALERAPGERAAFLERACAGDDELRREVEALLGAAEEGGDSFLERPATGEEAAALAAARASLEAGRVVGHYRVERQLGAGGMGEVYLATDVRNGRAAAVKLLPEQFADDDQRVRRFRAEARAALALNHPNVVTVYEIGEADGLHFIATEYIEGETLRARLSRTRWMELGEALDVAAQAAAALAYAHARGVVHRDIKPENLMLRPDGYVKVLDFGIAKLIGRAGPPAAFADISGEAATRSLASTSPGMVLGTAHYMSPEQARGLPVDERTDIWSLGCVLFEMVAGRRPFEGETASDTIALILQREPDLRSASPVYVPPEMERIIAKALDKRKDERYQTAKDLLADLRRFRRLHEQESEAGRALAPTAAVGANGAAGAATSDGGGATGAAGGARQTASSAEYIVEGVRRHKRAALFALALVVLLTAVLGAALYRLARRRGAAAAPDAAAPQIRITPFTVNGEVKSVAASPDGKYVAYALADDAKGEEGVWLRHLPTATDVRIIPSSKDSYGWFVFSPDSNYIYYRFFPGGRAPASLNRIPVVGGAPKTLVSDFRTANNAPVSFSPDGRRMAFIREEQGETKLIVANADGADERVLTSRKGDVNWLGGWPAWSPDGKSVAFIEGTYTGGYHHSLMTIGIEDGGARPLGTARWYLAWHLLWAPDGGGGLLVNARETQTGPAQVWRVSYPDGAARRLTNDLMDYQTTGLTRDGTTLTAFQTKSYTDIWAAPAAPGGRLTQLTQTKADGYWGVAWAPDGRIVFASAAGGEQLSLWVMNADGTGRRQLTSGGNDWAPSVSPDGRYVAFVSHRSGTPNVWRVPLDGGDLRQMTSGDSEANRSRYTPDGRWITFHSFRKGKATVWRMPAGGGEQVQISDRWVYGCEPSPDGRLLACVDGDAPPRMLRAVILPVEGGEPVRVIDLPPKSFEPFRWAPDGRAITFAHSAEGVENVWKMPLDGGKPARLTDFKPDGGAALRYHAFSPDGRTLAVARSAGAHEVVLISNFR